MKPIQMVDLQTQYQNLKPEIDAAIHAVLDSSAYINGPIVKSFQKKLEAYLGVKHVIPSANGTDALQIALMAVGLKPGDEVIVPAFTYVATAEVAGLLGLKIIMIDVDPKNFNIRAEDIEAAISPKTKAIIPVHLFGQSCPMEEIMTVAKKYNLFVIEDNAQAIGTDYSFSDGSKAKTGTIGHIGCTSFYPSKNLGAYGDGGAIFTNDDELAEKIRMIANHGQSRRYYHDLIGVNSRLDAIQAALLEVKLGHLDSFSAARSKAADYYDQAFSRQPKIQIPKRMSYSSHVFHQYTLQVPAEDRDQIQIYFKEKGIPSMIYYPLPLNEQEAFRNCARKATTVLKNTDQLCKKVLSLPMHPNLEEDQLAFISQNLLAYFQ